MHGWFTETTREAGVYAFIRGQLVPGQLWLIPSRLQTFRLATAAGYVDYKSHPYKDVEVLEWRRRLDRSVEWLRQWRWGDRVPA